MTSVRFNLQPISQGQTDFIGYGIYDSSINTVRIYLVSRGTSVESSHIAQGIPSAYRPKQSVAFGGYINSIFTQYCGVSSAGIVYQQASGAYTSAYIVGEYKL